MGSFHVVEHKVAAQHIREYANATANSQEDALLLSVKQYTPKDYGDPKPGDVTIIGAHANGFPKELYEPFWEDLLGQARKHGWRIRSIWIADVAHQGQSGILNEQTVGNDPSWHDHARDLLHLINVKRDEMPRPIIGVGHSMGGCQLAYLASMHPRLLTSLVLIDPTVQPIPFKATIRNDQAMSMATLATSRRSLWPSREAAAASSRKSAFYRSWDSRVFDKWIEHGLRDVPTALYPDARKPQVTLTTTVAQEVYSYLRPNYEGHGSDGRPMNRVTHPDLDPIGDAGQPFYRPELLDIFTRLPQLRPSVLYVFGSQSRVSPPALCQEKVSRTGTGIGGSGGAAEGRVKGVTLDQVGHLVPMEDPARSAQAAAAWIADELQRFLGEQEKWQKDWSARSLRDKQDISERWKETLRKPAKEAKI